MNRLPKIDEEIRRDLLDSYAVQRIAIVAKLEEFRAVPPVRYFYELCYCLLTPQSNAVQCDKVVKELERRRFASNGFDPEPLLRSFQGGYVRFHRTKALRLCLLKSRFGDVAASIAACSDSKILRSTLVDTVNGLGMKEASHFLRNIGRTDLAIIDRHIIRNLIRIGLLDVWPKSMSKKRYLEIEAMFESCAGELGIPVDELDLLLWSRETGFVLK